MSGLYPSSISASNKHSTVTLALPTYPPPTNHVIKCNDIIGGDAINSTQLNSCQITSVCIPRTFHACVNIPSSPVAWKRPISYFTNQEKPYYYQRIAFQPASHVHSVTISTDQGRIAISDHCNSSSHSNLDSASTIPHLISS
jgi:hypothetical protein